MIAGLAPYVIGALAPLAIVNARIEVGDGTVIDKGAVVVDGGKIVAVGANVVAPAGADVVDAKGRGVVTPGLIACDAQAGIVEVGLERSTVDVQLSGQAVPAFRTIDGYNPSSPYIPIDRAEGVTTQIATPVGALIYGQGVAVEMSGDAASAAAAKRVAMHGGFGGAAKESAGGARGGVVLRLREIFDDVRFYKANKAAYDRAATRELALPRVHLEALIDVVDGKLPLVLNVDRASDIATLLAFAKEQRVKVVVNGGAEAWVLAKELAQAQVAVILQPSAAEPWSFDALRARDDAAAILQKAGVVVALSAGPDHKGTTRVRQEAGVAVSYGMSHEAALQAVTQAPARIFGIDNDVGTVAVGKRANLVVWSGDPFETKTAADVVVIGGEKMSTDTRQLMLARRYRTAQPKK